MSFSAGVFSINSAGQPVVQGTVISSTAFNALTADLATGLSTAILKDGTQVLTSNIPMGSYILTGLGNSMNIPGGVITDTSDTTKKISFVVSGVTTGTTRTITVQNANMTLPVGNASQADQETGSSTTVFVTPGVQQNHASAAKAWVKFDASSGTPAINVAYNVGSLTDNGTGDFTANFTTAFSSSTYSWAFGGSSLTQDVRFAWQQTGAPGTTTFRFGTFNASFAAVDGSQCSVVFFGDQ